MVETYSQNDYTVGSLFAGVGGICQGFKNVGYSVSWANELDRHACDTYRLNHESTKLLQGDVNDLPIDELPQVTILTAGFPCQPFSVAGAKKGFNDKRGKVFYRVIDFLDTLKPKAFLLENVRHLVNHDKGSSFKKVRLAIRGSGYSFIPFILKSNEHCEIPQARERLYIVGFAGEMGCSYNSPIQTNNLKNLGCPMSSAFEVPVAFDQNMKSVKDYLSEDSIDETDYYNKFDNHIHVKVSDAFQNDCIDSVYQYRRFFVRKNKSKVCPTLTANMGGGGHNVPIIHDGKGPRRLNPRECFNLQGFSPDFQLPEMGRLQLYKQAGNSVVIPVIEKIAQNMIISLNKQ